MTIFTIEHSNINYLWTLHLFILNQKSTLIGVTQHNGELKFEFNEEITEEEKNTLITSLATFIDEP